MFNKYTIIITGNDLESVFNSLKLFCDNLNIKIAMRKFIQQGIHFSKTENGLAAVRY